MQPSQPPCPGRRGLTILEVMVAFTILAIVLTGVMGTLQGAYMANGVARDRELANDLTSRLVERLQTLDWYALMGGPGTPPNWTEERFAHLANGADDPGYAPLEEVDLLAEGVIDRPTGLAELQVFLEYYHALAPANGPVDSDAGLMESWDGTLLAHVPRNHSAGLGFEHPATLFPCRVTGTVAAVGKAPVVIRVLVRWNLDPTTSPGRRDGRHSVCITRMAEVEE